ncbi:Hint domain-containing protein [Acidocella aromatica]|uniref:Hedgehog/Intein (Hint) domain-containing protein n=1 Tax=Acidocella aromatica TaxID=1303579 RepID=A0A840VCY7_9PROT|nr:Hint domain-containing protein [Acidocella aromatica]MBB5372717.1 hypothetical protein [Acidocella aromatica]
MTTFNGTYTSEVTLSAGTANATLGTTGVINAYGPAGVGTININGTLTPEILSAALFAPASITANITNLGTIESHGTNASNWFDAGIVLGAPGTVINAGLIESAAGIFVGGGQGSTGAMVMNTGAVEGTVSVGIILTGAGTVLNAGSISGVMGAVLEQGTNASYLGNDVTGVITTSVGGAQAGYAVQMDGGGTLMNAGMIAGYSGGAELRARNTVTVFNAGTIASTGTASGSGAALSVGEDTIANAGAIIVNNAGGVISGQYGIEIYQRGTSASPGTMVNTIGNAGLVQGTRGAAIADWSGTAVLGNSGTILSTGSIGVDLQNGGTVFDSGVIQGATTALYMGGGGSDRLVLGAGASFGGSIAVNAAANATLELASSSSAGTFDMGGTVTGFDNIVFDTASTWTLEGNLAELGGGEMISGFSGADTLVLEGFTATSDQLIQLGGTDTYALDLSNGSSTVQLDLVGSFTANEITFSAVGAGTEIHLCYLRGTNILTPEGERLVESLRAGDEVLTRYAGPQRIKWIGRQDYAGRFIAANPEKIPVRILAGALGEGLPVRDLSLSPGHAVLLEETLVLAQSLVNGVTVLQDEAPELVAYYAIELETHDCVIAEGVQAESFADGPGLRNQFHNLAEFHALFPGYVEPDEIALCAPRPERGPALDAVLRSVVARAAARAAPGVLRGFVDLVEEDGLVEGWAQDMANPELPVLLEIRHGDEVLGTVLACDLREDLAAAGIGKGRAMFSFRVPGGLAGEARQTISVHRASDGAIVPLSGDCRARIGLEETRAA